MKIHSNRTFIRKSCFTLFELLISIGLLVVLSVVLLRTLILTSDYWIKTDEQAQLQADAKTFFSLLTDDLGNLVYKAAREGFYAPLHLENTRLCMVTHNTLQGTSNGVTPYSDISKVIYRYTAPSSGSSDPGQIDRLCSSDAVVSGNTLNTFDMTSSRSTGSSFYPAALSNRSMVIDTVADLRMSAYRVDGDELIPISNNDVFSSQAVRMIHVKLVLLPEKRFAEYNRISSSDTSARDTYIFKHGKIFYKAFWVNPSKQ